MNIFFKRISQIINYKEFKNVSDFAKNGLGWDSSEKINRLKKENSKPSIDILIEISNKFEDINLEWLITGKGEMLKSSGSILQNNTNGHNILGHKNKVNEEKSLDELISFLKKQLEEKDEQIRRKDEQIKMKEETINKLTDKIQSN